ncbi:hypothetical protein BH23CHL2_BH23CHL2_25890 [soil metagenome]
MKAGATAVVLMGSHARGKALPHSDIDLIALGDGPEYRLDHRDGYLVAVAWTTPEQVERDLLDPGKAGWVVRGWRDAVSVIDPAGTAQRLQQQARDWDWSEIGDDACNAYVAEELTGYAEEVQKLVSLLEIGNLTGAAVQRSILSLRIGQILAVHLRLLYASENDLWTLVGDELDDRWRAAQAAALGLRDEPFHQTCLAALELFRLSADIVVPLLDERQAAVVSAACSLQPQVER